MLMLRASLFFSIDLVFLKAKTSSYMKSKFYHLFLFFSLTLIAACYTGKKALKKGYYDQAVIEAVNRLRSKPTNSEATSILKEAYPMAQQYHLDRIKTFNMSEDNSRYDYVIAEYEALNRLYDQIHLSPAAMKVVTPVRYTAEINEYRLKSAELHYALGVKFLDKKNKTDAKIAYNEFEKARDLMQGNFKDCDVKMKEAMDWAVTKVIVLPVEIHSSSLKMSNEYFQNKILQYLEEHRISKFVEFYGASEAKRNNIRMDEVIDLSFDDFVVGQLMIEKLQRECIKDSVKVGETKLYLPELKRDTIIPVWGKAKATLFVTRRTVDSRGVLDMKIVLKPGDAIVQNEKMPGAYTWVNQFGYYQGDVKALTAEDLALTRGHEMLPPPPQDLFYEFTTPIFNQLITKINNRYRSY
jgi:hypothetical protein